MTKLLSAGELAKRYGVTSQTIRGWAGRGMPAAGVAENGRGNPLYDPAACDRWVRENRPGHAVPGEPAEGENPTGAIPSSVAPPPAPPSALADSGLSVADPAATASSFVIPPPPASGAAITEIERYDRLVKSIKTAVAVSRELAQLLPASEVRAGLARVQTRVRQRLEALPGRATPRILAELRAPQEQWPAVAEILADEIRQVCEELSEDPLGERTAPLKLRA